jgi:phytoene dehydrogenase-like protein
MIYKDEFVRIHGTDGKTFIVYKNLDRLEQHMKELAPADAKAIDEIVSAMRKMKKLDLPSLKAGELYTWPDMLKIMVSMFPLMGTMNRYGKMTLKELSEKITDPFLRAALYDIFDVPGFPATGFIVTMAYFDNRWQAIPEGGSLEFARAIEKRYRDLGGKIAFRTRIAKVLVEDDRAVGVLLADGTTVKADFVISACDGHETLFDFLEGRYVSEKLEKHYDSFPVFPSGVQVSLGVARDFSGEPYSQVFLLETPAVIAGMETDKVTFRHYCDDPTMAPKGKSVVISFYNADYSYWKKLAEDRPRYEAEKDKVAAFTIAELEKHYPGIHHQVEVIDVATPMTYVRYTGNWHGSFMGWLNGSRVERLGQRLPGLKNFYMAGIWTMVNGGVPTAALTARNAVELMCHDDGKKFAATVP